MKNFWTIILLVFSFTMLASETCQAQAFKGFGKKLENKLNKKIEDKADRHIDKTINKADTKSDKTIEKTIGGDENKSSKKKEEAAKKKTKNNNIIQSSEWSENNASTPNNQQVPIRKDQAMTLIGPNACKDFLWFKRGTVFEYEHESSSSSDRLTSRMRVNGVSQYQGETIADISSSQKTSDGEIEINLRYVCDTDNFYLDMSSIYEQMMQQDSEGQASSIKDVLDNSRIDVSEGFSAIPKMLYPGMKLPDTSFSFNMNSSGMELTMNSEVTGRIVVAREIVITNAGTFDAMKIKSNSVMKMQVMGRSHVTGNTVEYIWLAPEVGIVKQEVYSKDKLDYRMTLSNLQR